MSHQVWIPALYRDLTGGTEIVRMEGATVGELIANLDALDPGLAERLTDRGRVRPHLSVAVNGEMVARGLHVKLPDESEIHFVPALGGG